MKERRRRERNATRAAHMKKVQLRGKLIRQQRSEVEKFDARLLAAVSTRAERTKRYRPRQLELDKKRLEPIRKGAVTMKRAGLLLERLEKTHKFNVVKEIVDLYQKANDIEDLERRLRLQTKIATGLLDYCFPRLKAMELKNTDEKPTIINIQVPAQPQDTATIKAQRAAVAEKRRQATLAMADDWDEESQE